MRAGDGDERAGRCAARRRGEEDAAAILVEAAAGGNADRAAAAGVAQSCSSAGKVEEPPAASRRRRHRQRTSADHGQRCAGVAVDDGHPCRSLTKQLLERDERACSGHLGPGRRGRGKGDAAEALPQLDTVAAEGKRGPHVSGRLQRNAARVVDRHAPLGPGARPHVGELDGHARVCGVPPGDDSAVLCGDDCDAATGDDCRLSRQCPASPPSHGWWATGGALS